MLPTFLDNMSWAMAEVYGAVSDKILINLARYFPYAHLDREVRNLFNYQARMLAQLGQVNKETIQIIAEGLGGADAALKQSLEAAILEALKDDEPALRKAAEQGLLPGGRTIPPVLAPNQMQAFRYYYQQSADKLNLVNTVMLESTQQAYVSTVSDIAARIAQTQTILNTETGAVISGVSTYNEAMHDGVQRMVANGLTGFIDHGGHKWSPETYVAMDIRSTLFNTAREAVWERNAEYGNDLYQVSSKAAARPLCYPWQGKIISRTGGGGVYAIGSQAVDMPTGGVLAQGMTAPQAPVGGGGTTTDLYGNTITVHSEDEIESFRYGGGLFGVNCGHYPMVFIPGVSTVTPPPQNEEANAKAYAESQQQRQLERDLREERRKLEVLKAQGATDAEIKAQQARVNNASHKIDDFCDETGRARRRSREYTPVNATWPNPQATPGGTATPPASGPSAPTPPAAPTSATIAKEPEQPVTMEYGKPFDAKGKPWAEQNASAKQALDEAPDDVKRVWSKAAKDLKQPDYASTDGASYYSLYDKQTHFVNPEKAYGETSSCRANERFFHEFGHNIDNRLASRDFGYFSYEYKENLFGRTILQDCESTVTSFWLRKNGFSDMETAITQYGSQAKVMAKVHSKSTGNAFCKWAKTNYTLYQRADVSDIYQKYMEEHYGIPYPFGAGHRAGYFNEQDLLASEAFAEMFSATIAQPESLATIKELLPQSYGVFEEMLKEMAK